MIKYENEELEAEGTLKELTEEWYYLTDLLIENISKNGNVDETLTNTFFIESLEQRLAEVNKGEINE